MPVWLGVIKEMKALTRLFSTFIVVVSLLISILCCVGLHASPENIKPNAILMMSDDIGAEGLALPCEWEEACPPCRPLW